MKHSIKYLFLAAFASLLIIACERNFFDPEPNNLTNDLLYDLMNKYYLWYDQMPEVNPNNYSSLSSLLDALMYKPTDRWSYVISTDDYNNLVEGEYTGHGFGLKWDTEGNLRITFVYSGTSAQSQGVDRGWEVLSINGVAITPETYADSLLGADSAGVQNTFLFLDNNQQSVNLTLTKELIDIKAVLHSEVIELDSATVGYLVYQTFITSSKEELDEVFGTFIESEVDELIVDLRYNTGGFTDVAQHLGSLLAGDFALKRTFVQFEHNDKNSQHNITKPFLELENMLVPTPDRIFFITTNSSASASELLINGLLGLTGLNRELYIYLIGDDTHGKPVGSIARPYSDSTLIPITFKYTNRLGDGDFYDGLPADSYIEEDLSKDFGDPEEYLLKEVLYFIENDEFTGAGKKKSRMLPDLQLKGIHSEIGAI
jgi:C-terminal processing protease CtpA/Prc